MEFYWTLKTLHGKPHEMKTIFLGCVLGIALCLTTACKQSPATKESSPEPIKTEAKKDSKNDSKIWTTTNEVAVIKTSEGEMVAEFWPDVAPKTVENFKTLAKKGFYDGTAFHRVIRGFMIQGGDPLTKDASQEERWGTGDPGYKLDAEFNDRSHQRGVLSMARSPDPNSAGSQFFICHGDASQLDHQYSAFGKLIKGDDVLEKIATTPTHPPDRPDKRIGVESIKIVPANSLK